MGETQGTEKVLEKLAQILTEKDQVRWGGIK
jgi:hypothetical protein